MPDLVGQHIDQYRLDALLGQGGVGTLYRAYDLALGRSVALKLLPPSLSQQKRVREIFLREVRAAARLEHPAIVDVHNFGVHEDTLYVVRAYLPGGGLDAYIRRLDAEGVGIDLREVLTLMAQVAEGLGYAHRQGVIHRGLKPGNVLLEQAAAHRHAAASPVRAVIADFGVARLLEEDGVGNIAGALSYMSPEQCLGGEIGSRSDVYSLGVLLYRLCTGRLPFDIQTPTDAVVKHMKETAPPPGSIVPALPAKVDAIIRKAIASVPENRFESGAQLAHALRAAADGFSESEATAFVGSGTVLTVATALRERRPDSPPKLEAEASFTPSASRFQLVVAGAESPSTTISLERLEYTLGRAESNDIPLDAAGVSREHARIERTLDGWQVVDLGSTNGTFVEKNRLMAGVPEPWEANRTLRIGPFFLRWRRDTGASASVPDEAVSAAELQRPASRVALAADPLQLTVEPGASTSVAVRLLNQGVTENAYGVSVHGLSEAWVTAPDEPVQLSPGRQESVDLHFHPPRASTTPAGRHAFQIVVRPREENAPATSADGQLVVRPFFTLSAQLAPERVKIGESCRLVLRNEGNAPLPVRIEAGDADGELTFEIEGRQVTVPAGGEQTVTIVPDARSLPLWGGTRSEPFSVRVVPAMDEADTLALTLSGTVTIPSRVGRWFS